jgi:hypothetical protein
MGREPVRFKLSASPDAKCGVATASDPPRCRECYHFLAMPSPEDSSAGDPEQTPAVTRPATLLEVVRAVFWSFFGVRRGDAMRRDAVSIRPHQVIIVGILIAAALVVALIILVRIITRNA